MIGWTAKMRTDYLNNKEDCWYKDICPKYKSNCSSSCVRFLKMSFLANNALLTPRQQHPIKLLVEDVDLEAYNKLNDIKKNIVKFVQDSNNLLIHSKTTGNGKTEWSLKLIMSYFDKIWPYDDFTVRGLFINVQRFFNTLKEDINESQEYIKHIRDNIVKADLVIWDEIGIKNLSNYEHDYLLSYINARIDNGKSNIFTTNASIQELYELLGDRLYSRIINTSIIVELKGCDKRGMNND